MEWGDGGMIDICGFFSSLLSIVCIDVFLDGPALGVPIGESGTVGVSPLILSAPSPIPAPTPTPTKEKKEASPFVLPDIRLHICWKALKSSGEKRPYMRSLLINLADAAREPSAASLALIEVDAAFTFSAY